MSGMCSMITYVSAKPMFSRVEFHKRKHRRVEIAKDNVQIVITGSVDDIQKLLGDESPIGKWISK